MQQLARRCRARPSPLRPDRSGDAREGRNVTSSSSSGGPTLACTMVRLRRIRERRPTGQSVGNDERLCKSGFDGPAHDLDPLPSIPVASQTSI